MLSLAGIDDLYIMEKKECPSCAMEVDAGSKVCPVCGYEFTRQGGGIKWAALLLALLFLLYLIFF
jgi:predicted amidophosphoribosyltransferase